MDKDTSRTRRVIGVVIAVVGLVAVLASVGSATWWRPSGELRATTAAASGAQYAVTAPGVLQLSGPVHVTATGPAGSTVTLAVGHEVDVAGWLDQSPVAVVTGLASRSSLRSDVQQGLGTSVGPASSASPSASAGTSAPTTDATTPSSGLPLADSDMWLAHETGPASASLTWSGADTRALLLTTAVGADGSMTAPALTLAWTQKVSTPWEWPGIALGALLLALGVILLVRTRRPAQDQADDEQPPTSGALAAVGSAGPAQPREPEPVASGLGAFSPREVTVTRAPEETGAVPASAATTPEKAAPTVGERKAPAPAAAPGPASSEVGRTVVGRHTAPVPRVPEPSAAPFAPAGATTPDTTRFSAPVAVGDSSPVPVQASSTGTTPVAATPPAATPVAAATTGAVATGATPTVDGEPMTRRRLRELRAQGLLPPVGAVSAGVPVASGATRPVGGGPVGAVPTTGTRPGTVPQTPRPATPQPPMAAPVGPGPETGATPALPDGSAASAAGWRQAWGLPGAPAAPAPGQARTAQAPSDGQTTSPRPPEAQEQDRDQEGDAS